jgi:transcriptional regulator
MQGQTLKGHLDLLLLAVVGVGPAHGYAIAERLRTRSGGALNLPEGTLYPALHRLERSGLLASGWDEVSSRRRRVYRLTSKGVKALAKRHHEWMAFAKVVDGVVTG